MGETIVDPVHTASIRVAEASGVHFLQTESRDGQEKAIYRITCPGSSQRSR